MHGTETTSPGDADEYRRRSYRNWQSAAAGWEREREAVQAALGPLTDWMLAHLAAEPGQTVLELGAGTAETGLAAPRPRVAGRPCDRERPVERHGRRGGAPGGRARPRQRRDAGDRHRGDRPPRRGRRRRASAGSRSCSCPTPPRRWRRSIGSLRPGGRLAATVWDTVDRNPWAPALWEVLEGMTDLPPARPGGPGMFSLADAGRLSALLAAQGSATSTSSRIPVAWRYPDFETYWQTQSALNGAVTQLLPALAGRARPAGGQRRATAVERLPHRGRLRRSRLGAGRRRHTRDGVESRAPCRSTCAQSRATTRPPSSSPATRSGPSGSRASSSTTPAR